MAEAHSPMSLYTMLVVSIRTLASGNIPEASLLSSLASKVLGYCIVAGASVIKLPLIINVLRAAKGVDLGISLVSLEIETFAFGVTLANMLNTGLPFSAYGELVFVMIQNNLLLAIVAGKSDKVSFIRASVPTTLMGHIPTDVIELCTSLTTIMIVASRLPQIYSNYTSRNTGQLSGLSQFMMVSGGLARVFTGMQEGASLSIIVGTIIGVVLNATILMQIIIYYKPTIETKSKKE